MYDIMGLKGKVGLVLGGGLGMGECTAMRLAEAGCDIAVADIDRDRAERVADMVRQGGRNAIAIVADVLDETTAESSIAKVETELGRLDVMAAIVGQAGWSRVLDMTPATWEQDHRRNLRYFFFYAQAAARSMVRAGRPGAITAVASVSGIQSAPGHASYGAAKAGLMNLVKTMGVELAEYGIRVNAVAPGTIETPRITESRSPEENAQWRERIANSMIPAKAQGTPDDIAKAILFFSSDLARYVTGQTLAVDGGWTAQFLIGVPRDPE